MVGNARRGPRPAAVAIACSALCISLLVAAPAQAGKGKRRVEVHPGKRNAITKAIERVRRGGVVRIHRGRYRESVIVDKKVKLWGVDNKRAVIDGRCKTRFTVSAAANGVIAKHLKIVGADERFGYGSSEIDFRGVKNGKVNDLVLRDTCEAEYGVNVLDTGPVDVRDSRASGFDDAGFYVGQITGTGDGSIRIRDSEAYGNNRGVIIEEATGGRIRVTGNDLHDNDANPGFDPPTGIFLNRADGVLVGGNEISGNLRFGLRISEGSDFNVINDNAFADNPIDVLDVGVGTCGTGNTYATGTALPPC